MGYVTSPTVSVPQPSLHYLFGVDTSISHLSIGNDAAKESQNVNTTPFSPSQVSITHVYPIQFGFSQVSSSQVSSRKIGVTNYSLVELNSAENSVSKVTASQIALSEISSTEISLTKVGSLQVTPVGNKSTQTSLTQVNSTPITIQSTSTKVDSTQIPSIKQHGVFLGIQSDTTEISLSSSITLQQLLSSHNFNLQNTTVPTWLEFLQGPSPFNLNIEIADLPTGQLAEANITGFDPTGRPNSGTLYLDVDANGFGWYIDSTPWDNTEYSQTLTDAAYRATSDSAAYGHYDLLTTILHETAHLQGFIAGYSNYDRHIQTQNGSKTFVGDNFSAILLEVTDTILR
jgi:hypothetical protein